MYDAMHEEHGKLLEQREKEKAQAKMKLVNRMALHEAKNASKNH